MENFRTGKKQENTYQTAIRYRAPHRQDPYRSEAKPEGTPRCPTCQAVSIEGRWVSQKELKEMRVAVPFKGELKCPACRQLEDHFAMGVVELHGELWKTKRDLVLNTIYNTEGVARFRNDQERILWLHESEPVTKVYVSLPELARQVGRQLQKSFHGKTMYHRSTEEPFLRVIWNSDPVLEEEAKQKSRSFRRRGE